VPSGFWKERAENTRALFGFGKKDIQIRQDSLSREHPSYKLVGTDLILIVPRRAVLYSRPGFGMIAAFVERVARCARGAGFRREISRYLQTYN